MPDPEPDILAIKKAQQEAFHKALNDKKTTKEEKAARAAQSGFATFARNRRHKIKIHYPGGSSGNEG